MTEALRTVAMQARPATREFNTSLARRLRQRHGSEIHLYCNSPEEVAYYRQRNGDGVFASVTDGNVLLPTAVQPVTDADEVLAAARALETRIDATINSVAVANRHVGRGFALGGFGHPRSRYSEESNYLSMLQAYVAAFAFWERELSERGATLLLNGDKIAALTSRSLRVPYRAMAGSRFRNLHYWAWNEYYDNPRFAGAFERAAGDSDLVLDQPYDAHMANRAARLRQRRLAGVLKWMGSTTAHWAYGRIRGYAKARGYYLSDTLAYEWRTWSQERALRSMATTRLSHMQGQSFVYFPLHVEPEAALQIISPEYLSQLNAITSLSRDLPAGTVLAVKEAFGAIGRRPADFYRQIQEFKNVVLLETMELGLDCVRAADAVATICGTAGLEGAAMGKPVIAFGRHNIYAVAPHVRTVRDESALAPDLRWAIEGPHDRETMARDGVRLLEAIAEESFDMRGYRYADPSKVDPEAVESAVAMLEASVSDDGVGAGIQAGAEAG